MRVYQTKEFARFARKMGVAGEALFAAATAVASGQWDADLGGGVFKQRIARAGSGKSGGYRTIILFRTGSHSFFVHGFAKNDKANVTAKELRALKALAKTVLAFDDVTIWNLAAIGEMIEVWDDGEDDEQG